jgi:hypothetical protein
VTFWCVHSSESRHVEREWRAAEKAGKRLLPVLLDDTTMPDGLGRYQGVDFRTLVRDSHKGSSGDTMNAFNPFAIFILPLVFIWAAIQALVGQAGGRSTRPRGYRYAEMAKVLGDALDELP